MCGRTACALNPEDVCRACEYKDNISGKLRKPSWVKSELNYVPSCNIGPRDVLPCIVAGSHFNSKEERILCAMMWGMIPFWHKGDYRKHGTSTHNARLEGIKNSTLYSNALRKQQRCIVICEGYYEWQAGETAKDPKQPYYIYAKQNDNTKSENCHISNEWSEGTGRNGCKILKMAGLFGCFKTGNGDTIYSCTVITREANDILSWLHHRVPVFLTTEEDAKHWLNKAASINEVVDKLTLLTLTTHDVEWYKVSTLVNNVLHKSDECRKPTTTIEKKKSGSASFMASWLKQGSTRSLAQRGEKRKDKDMDDTKESCSDETRKLTKIAKQA